MIPKVIWGGYVDGELDAWSTHDGYVILALYSRKSYARLRYQDARRITVRVQEAKRRPKKRKTRNS